MNEKNKVEERLKQELESEREKDKKLTEELLQQKKNLEKVGQLIQPRWCIETSFANKVCSYQKTHAELSEKDIL